MQQFYPNILNGKSDSSFCARIMLSLKSDTVAAKAIHSLAQGLSYRSKAILLLQHAKLLRSIQIVMESKNV